MGAKACAAAGRSAEAIDLLRELAPDKNDQAEGNNSLSLAPDGVEGDSCGSTNAAAAASFDSRSVCGDGDGDGAASFHSSATQRKYSGRGASTTGGGVSTASGVSATISAGAAPTTSGGPTTARGDITAIVFPSTATSSATTTSGAAATASGEATTIAGAATTASAVITTTASGGGSRVGAIWGTDGAWREILWASARAGQTTATIHFLSVMLQEPGVILTAMHYNKALGLLASSCRKKPQRQAEEV